MDNFEKEVEAFLEQDQNSIPHEKEKIQKERREFEKKMDQQRVVDDFRAKNAKAPEVGKCYIAECYGDYERMWLLEIVSCMEEGTGKVAYLAAKRQFNSKRVVFNFEESDGFPHCIWFSKDGHGRLGNDVFVLTERSRYKPRPLA